MVMRITKFRSYKLYNEAHIVGLSSERVLARLKALPNKNGHVRTETETNEYAIQSVLLSALVCILYKILFFLNNVVFIPY
jgi:hypothetical protein